MLKKLSKNNKGAFTLWQRGYMYAFLFVIFAFAIDIALLGVQTIFASHQVNYCATKLAFQGGCLGSNVNNAKYWSNEDFYTYINASMVRFGVDGLNLHWNLYVDEGSGNQKIVDTDTGSPVSLNYISRPLVVNGGSVAPNYNSIATLTLGYQHKFFFSNRIFNFMSPDNFFYLTAKYQNEYING